MKKTFKNKIGFVIASAFALTSCDSYLDLSPNNYLSDKDAITNEQTAKAALNGAYSALQNYYSGDYISLGSVTADLVDYNGSRSEILQLDQNAVSPDNRASVSAYQGIYKAINSANYILSDVDGLNDPTFTEVERNQAKGEAYFIRALSYFDLSRAWGGVQIETQPTKELSVIAGIKRSSLEQTQAQVLSDLDNAEELLPEDDATTRNRAQKNAAKALKARLYLYQGDYENAEREATQVINSKKYALVKPYNLFFKEPFQTTESVFELQFSTNDRNGYWSNWFPVSLGGDYTLKPSDKVVRELQDPNVGGTRKAKIAETNGAYYGVLYNTSSSSTDPVYVIRIAELYLIRAEARAKKANPDLEGAVSDLNTIRERADVPDFTLSGHSQADVIQAIEDENAVEFAFEGHRFFDLTRTNRAGEVLGLTNKDSWLLPIPSSDILSDPDVTQNPGY